MMSGESMVINMTTISNRTLGVLAVRHQHAGGIMA
jgi:hypothetical protein